MTKMVVLDGEALCMKDLSWAPLEKLGELTVYDRTPPELTITRALGAEALFTNKTRLSADIISQLPDLRYIGVLATGYDVVDVAAAKQRGIPVCNVPSYGTDAVAQFAWGLILEHFLAVGRHAEFVKEGGWQRHPDYTAPLQTFLELKGKTIGIVGFGRIGQKTAEIAAAFGMEVLAYDIRRSHVDIGASFRWVELDELYREADIISLHCYLTEDNRGMINRHSIAQMKEQVLIVNTARGGLVNEADLLQALQDGRIGGAALDVISTEPPTSGNILIGAPRCIITPHVAWASLEGRRRLMDIAANNLKEWLDGHAVHCVY